MWVEGYVPSEAELGPAQAALEDQGLKVRRGPPDSTGRVHLIGKGLRADDASDVLNTLRDTSLLQGLRPVTRVGRIFDALNNRFGRKMNTQQTPSPGRPPSPPLDVAA